MGGARQDILGRPEIRTESRLENLKERANSNNLDVDGRIVLKGIFGKRGCRARTRYIWLTIRTAGELL
jgi:hypothetical protein